MALVLKTSWVARSTQVRILHPPLLTGRILSPPPYLVLVYDIDMERWLSGRKRLTANEVSPQGDRGFESHPLRQSKISNIVGCFALRVVEELTMIDDDITKKQNNKENILDQSGVIEANRDGGQGPAFRIPPSPPEQNIQHSWVFCSEGG